MCCLWGSLVPCCCRGPCCSHWDGVALLRLGSGGSWAVSPWHGDCVSGGRAWVAGTSIDSGAVRLADAATEGRAGVASPTPHGCRCSGPEVAVARVCAAASELRSRGRRCSWLWSQSRVRMPLLSLSFAGALGGVGRVMSCLSCCHRACWGCRLSHCSRVAGTILWLCRFHPCVLPSTCLQMWRCLGLGCAGALNGGILVELERTHWLQVEGRQRQCQLTMVLASLLARTCF